MAELSQGAKEALLAATTVEEAMAALATDGIEATAEEATRALEEARKRTDATDVELSEGELAAVAGGLTKPIRSGRDAAREGCASTVERWSWCWTNDDCAIWDVVYSRMPTPGRRECVCGGTLYVTFGMDYIECDRCDRLYYLDYTLKQ